MDRATTCRLAWIWSTAPSVPDGDAPAGRLGRPGSARRQRICLRHVTILPWPRRRLQSDSGPTTTGDRRCLHRPPASWTGQACPEEPPPRPGAVRPGGRTAPHGRPPPGSPSENREAAGPGRHRRSSGLPPPGTLRPSPAARPVPKASYPGPIPSLPQQVDRSRHASWPDRRARPGSTGRRSSGSTLGIAFFDRMTGSRHTGRPFGDVPRSEPGVSRLESQPNQQEKRTTTTTRTIGNGPVVPNTADRAERADAGLRVTAVSGAISVAAHKQ